MKVVLYLFAACAIFGYAMCASSSKSCSCSNGVCNCEESADPSGNVAGSSALSSSGMGTDSMYNFAGTGSTGTGTYNSQSSSVGGGFPGGFGPGFGPGFGFPGFGGFGFPGGFAGAFAGRRR